MTGIWPWVLVIPISYGFGSIPFGVLLGRRVGVDVRGYGSGGTGATNVARTLGVKTGIAVLALDLGKGIAAVFLAHAVSDSTVLAGLAGFLALVGHVWPVFARFQGGKGVATGLGALFVISPLSGLATFVGLLVAAGTRYVSLGSIIGTICGCVMMLAQVYVLHDLAPGYLVFGIGGMGLIIARHRSNVRRLIEGREHKFGARVANSAP